MKMNQEKLEEIATKQIPIEDEMKEIQSKIDEWEDMNRYYKDMLAKKSGYSSEENVKKAIKENNKWISNYKHHDSADSFHLHGVWCFDADTIGHVLQFLPLFL